MESILASVKKLLGISHEYTHFDSDIIMHINTVFMVLQQLGVGPKNGFYIEDDTSTWADFLGDPTHLQMVKTYVGLKVRKIFDPPTSSALMNAIDQSIAEFEWRLYIAAETGMFTKDDTSDEPTINTSAVLDYAIIGQLILA